MSTRLLLRPGKVHELCDDLESIWFVLLFEGLHFLKHNRPGGINMAITFDQVGVSLITGNHIGGLGKTHLYFTSDSVVDRTLRFESEPFTALVGQIYRLFQSFNAYYMARDMGQKPNDSQEESVRKLESCAEIKRLLGEALDSGGWPELCDKVQDQYPPIRHLTPEQKDTVALSYVNRALVPSGEPSGAKRKREEEEDTQVPETKRTKTGPPLWKRIWSKCASLARG